MVATFGKLVNGNGSMLLGVAPADVKQNGLGSALAAQQRLHKALAVESRATGLAPDLFQVVVESDFRVDDTLASMGLDNVAMDAGQAWDRLASKAGSASSAGSRGYWSKRRIKGAVSLVAAVTLAGLALGFLFGNGWWAALGLAAATFSLLKPVVIRACAKAEDRLSTAETATLVSVQAYDDAEALDELARAEAQAVGAVKVAKLVTLDGGVDGVKLALAGLERASRAAGCALVGVVLNEGGNGIVFRVDGDGVSVSDTAVKADSMLGLRVVVGTGVDAVGIKIMGSFASHAEWLSSVAGKAQAWRGIDVAAAGAGTRMGLPSGLLAPAFVNRALVVREIRAWRNLRDGRVEGAQVVAVTRIAA